MNNRGFLDVVEVLIILLVSALALSLILGRNVPKTYNQFRLQSGEVVECSEIWHRTPAIDLKDCKDGNNYLRQVNVVELGD